LPAAQGAYGGKTEQPDETRGKKKRWTVTELIALGLQLIKWDGRYAAFWPPESPKQRATERRTPS
jgi:hypothetical protein